tara:strand:- start:1554 stop:2339 length:786 start_codon:yes stop_codon:yes gene_type:complete
MFFVRCYRQGAAKSGTTNLQEWEDCPNLSDFQEVCEANGEGKYVLFQRGKGIRGMKKVNEYIIEKEAVPDVQMGHNGTNNPSLRDLLVFAAEEVGVPNIAVKKNMKADELDDEQLLDIIDSLADKKVSSAEEFEAFSKDIKALIKEVKNRGMSSEGFNADMVVGEVVQTKAFGGFFGGLAVGVISGIGGTAAVFKKREAEMMERFGALEASMAETEKTLKKQAEERAKEKKAEAAVRAFDSRLNLDASFLSNFNGNNGPKY